MFQTCATEHAAQVKTMLNMQIHRERTNFSVSILIRYPELHLKQTQIWSAGRRAFGLQVTEHPRVAFLIICLALTWVISSWVVLSDLMMLSSWTRPESRLCSSWASSSCRRLSSILERLASSSWLRRSVSWERIWLCSDDIWRARAEMKSFSFVASTVETFIAEHFISSSAFLLR